MTYEQLSKQKAKPTLQETVAPTPKPCRPTPQKRVVAGVCAGLVLVCIAIYGQTLFHDFVNLDDNLYVTENPYMQAGLTWDNTVRLFTDVRAFVPYPHPITLVTHGVDCELYGVRPWGHHLTNLIIHIMNSILLFIVFARMTHRLWPSAFVAALFAVHPLNVESVAWIAERKNVVSMFFWIATVGVYVRYRQKSNLKRYLAVAFMFLLALLSKPMVVTLPFVLLLLDYWPLNQMDHTAPFGVLARKAVRLIVEKIPLILMTALFCVAVVLLELAVKNLIPMDEVPFPARCTNAVVVYALYLVKAVWPTGLAAFYPFPAARPLWQVAGAAVFLAAITLFCFRQARRRPYLIVGWLWYLGTLVPIIGLVQAGNFSHGDRFTYIPLVGVFTMVAWGAADLAAVWHVPKRLVAAFSVTALIAMTVCAAVQTTHWRDSTTLFSHAIAVGHTSGLAYNNLGQVALEQERFEDARAFLVKALDTNPECIDALNNLGVLALKQRHYEEAKTIMAKALDLAPRNWSALTNLGMLALELRRYDEARSWLTRALEVIPMLDPKILNNMGLLALYQRRFDEAKSWLEKSLDVNPTNSSALNNMGLLALEQQRYDEAKTWLAKALDLNPENVEALNNMGRIALYQQHYDESKQYFMKALSLKPGYVNAVYNMGVLAMNQERYDEAKSWLTKARDLAPENVDVLNDLGLLAMDQGRYDEATPWLIKALELNPGHVNALNNMGWYLMNQGQYEEAQSYFRRTLEMDPQFTRAMINLGDTLAKLGRQEEANTYFERAAELNRSRMVKKK